MMRSETCYYGMGIKMIFVIIMLFDDDFWWYVFLKLCIESRKISLNVLEDTYFFFC